MRQSARNHPTSALKRVAPLLALLVGGACKDFAVPNYNAGSITDLQQGANASAVGAAAVGLLAISRDFESSFLQSHVALTGTFGREGVELDPSNPQHPVDRLDAIGSGEQGYAGWSPGYRLIKQANVILGALSSAVGMTDPQKAGVRGFAKTLQALALLRLLNVFDQAGLPIDVDIATTAPPAAVATRAQVQARISTLLDDAYTELGNAGTAFSFTVPAGYVAPATQGGNFNTPATFRTFNRALKARIEAHRGSFELLAGNTAAATTAYAAALTAIGQSFITTAAGSSLRYGVYDSYSTRSGDRVNPLFDPTCRQLFVVPQVATGTQAQPGGAPDARYTSKTRRIPGLAAAPATRTIHGYDVDSCFTLYPTADTPIPVIRNEELILLRAEAEYFAGSQANALADINYVRQTAGGLAARGAFASQTDFVDELLYNRLYSLMWEGGHRWVDSRRFGRLLTLPRTPSAGAPRASNRIFPYLHLPPDECLPRNNPAASCTAPAGI